MNLIQETLVESNLAVVGRVVRREMARGVPSWVDRSDLESVGNLALVRAAAEFADQCEFPAFAYRSVRGAVLDELRAIQVRNRGRADMPNDVDIQPFSGSELDLYAAMSALPAREYRAIVLQYWAGSSQTEIAEILGVSQQSVSRILFSAKKSLRQCVDRQTQSHTYTNREERPEAA